MKQIQASRSACKIFDNQIASAIGGSDSSKNINIEGIRQLETATKKVSFYQEVESVGLYLDEL